MNLFLARTCLKIWQPQVSCCKMAQALFLSLTENHGSNIKLKEGTPAPKSEHVCLHVYGPCQLRVAAALYGCVCVTK